MADKWVKREDLKEPHKSKSFKKALNEAALKKKLRALKPDERSIAEQIDWGGQFKDKE